MVKTHTGQLLNETYRVEGLVGQGAMGAVYEASHTRLPRRFAVKILARRALPSAEARARFEREAEVTSRLKHANIVDIIDFNHAPDGTPYIVMELLRGTDLRQRLAEVGRFDCREMTGLLRQAAAGLQAAHDHGIIHRDLKPSNIFICSGDGTADSEVVKLVDFGLSKPFDASHELTGADELIGTPWYMSPEQADGRAAEATVRSDVFSLAVIVYEMLTGNVPFRSENVLAALRKIVAEEPPAMSSFGVIVPPALEAAVRRGLAKCPEDRHASVRELATEICEAAAKVDDAGRTLDWEAPSVSPESAAMTETLPVPAEAPAAMTETLPVPAEAPAAMTETLPVPTEAGGADQMPDTTLAVPRPRPAPPRAGRVLLVFVLGVLGGVGVWLGLSLGEPPLQEGPAVDRDVTLAAAPVATPDLGGKGEPDLAPVISAAPDAAAVSPDSTMRSLARRELWLATRPAGAEVVVDGRRVGTTPIEGLLISADAVFVRVKKRGYAARRIDLTAGTDAVHLGPVALRRASRPAGRPVARTATLQVATLVDGQHTPADVYLNDKPRGQSPLRLERVPAGVPLTLTIRKAGYPPRVRKFRLQPGQIRRIVVDLKR